MQMKGRRSTKSRASEDQDVICSTVTKIEDNCPQSSSDAYAALVINNRHSAGVLKLLAALEAIRRRER